MLFNKTPEHLHVMLNHLPLIGLLAAMIALSWGLLTRQRQVLSLAFFLTLLFAGSTPIIMATGERAMERFDLGLIQPPLDGPGNVWMSIHYKRAETGNKALYATAALGLIGLLAAWKMPTAVFGLAIATLLFVIMSVGFAAWTADAGGKIRHPEFRPAVEVTP